jgi:hypothetical protein
MSRDFARTILDLRLRQEENMTALHDAGYSDYARNFFCFLCNVYKSFGLPVQLRKSV